MGRRLTTDSESKALLKELLENNRKIPFRLWRRVLWLQDNEALGIDRSGRFHWKDKKGKFQIRSWKGFFASKKREIINFKRMNDILNDYLLIVHQDQLKARDILRCRNAEIRRYLLKEYGYSQFFQELSGVVIHRQGDSELISLQIRKDEDPLIVIKVKDSTSGEIYILRVHPEVRTCQEAIAWTFGLQPDEYNPTVET